MDANTSSSTNAQGKYCSTVVCNTLNDLRKKKELCDLIVEVDNVEYFMHKIVLFAFSPFFEGKFSGDLVESKEIHVNLSNIDASVMELILDYAYSGSIQITKNNMKLILHVAHFLQAKSLFDECCRALENDISISADKISDVWNLSKVYSRAKEILKKCVLAHFTEVSNKSEFVELEAGMLIDVISSENLVVDKEETVFDAVIRWFNHKEEERKEFLDEVILKTTGNEKYRVTVMLCVTADGRKLPPFLIFKRKNIPKAKKGEAFPPGLVIRAQEKGWMTEDLMIDWLKTVWRAPPAAVYASPRRFSWLPYG